MIGRPQPNGKSRPWESWEDKLIMDVYPLCPTPILAKRLKRSPSAVQVRASYCGVKKRKK